MQGEVQTRLISPLLHSDGTAPLSVETPIALKVAGSEYL